MLYRRPIFAAFAFAVTAIGVLPAQLPAAPPDTAIDFDRQIAPILLRHCSGCHNPGECAGGLNLLSAAGAFAGGKSGEPAIKPSDLDNSYAVTRIEAGEMPPPAKGKPLAAEEFATLKRWIEAGAPWPKDRTLDLFELTTETRAGRDWWSLKPPSRPPLPQVKDASWLQTPIDAFVLAKLEERGLRPSPEADRTTIIRRATLDLIGLPPTPEEIQAFVSDQSPVAYERLIDRLLASPQYGERWARHWLDVVRFAESGGFENNLARPNAWPYRDYVIESLNSDKPYTQFIIEQLAGDQVGAGTATGFLVAGPRDEVKSPDEELTRMQRLNESDDLISTTATAFLGLTAGCAKCHDHKFDPISQRDYYSLASVFAGVQHGERELETPKAKENRKRREEITREMATAEREKRSIAAGAEPPARVADDGKKLKPERMPIHPAGNVDQFAPVTAKFVRFTIRATNNLEPCIDELEIYSAEKPSRNVALASAGAIATASGVIDDGKVSIHQLAHINDGRYGNSWSWISNEVGRGWVQIELPSPTLIDRVEWARDRKGEFNDRLPTSYVIEVAQEPDKWQTIATSDDRAPYDPKGKSPAANSDNLPTDEAKRFHELAAKIDGLKEELAKIQPQMVYAGTFAEPKEPTFRLHRGDPMQRREEMTPGAIAAAGKPLTIAHEAPEAARRLALARWIADEQNPLTARVMVNRIWHNHFGQGLMRNPSDFGFNGGWPSHPELLDWLATEFMAGGWRMKQIHRLIMLSSTYRQSNRTEPRAAEVDGTNSLLWHFRLRRLEAEPIRDSVLAVSGALDTRLGGPGFDVFEPNDNYVKVYIPKQTFGPAEWRRAIYLSKPRMQFDATFGAFDCPDSAQPLAKRNSSTTAIQALNLLNAPFMTQQAEMFAKRLSREAPDDAAARVKRAFWLAFGRPPDNDEERGAVALTSKKGLTALCRALLNANEFLYMP
jgi:hypothetical protein